jgi:hypothetical protein
MAFHNPVLEGYKVSSRSKKRAVKCMESIIKDKTV